ncbi:MAG: Gfo/Idh/MocA family oxidoreductase [Kiritimatiellales bacterium]
MSKKQISNGLLRKRYVIIGAGRRSELFSDSILGSYAEVAELVGYCDPNPVRPAYYNSVYAEKYNAPPVPVFPATEFDRMLEQQRPDFVIVSCIDRLHHEYIVRALDAGCDVITEKPMTTDIPKCKLILDAVERTGRSVRVAFNYRYSPVRCAMKELLLKKTVGDITSVHFEWLLDTKHGADYFRRWHRNKINSGGLMVHKSTHHFDLVNWWLDSSPETVFGFGTLAFYGKVNAEARGEVHNYFRGTSPEAKGDPFALDLRKSKMQEEMYYKAEAYDHYLRDQNVFGDGIDIEDTMNVLVRYRSGAQMTYSLMAYSPWEGCRIAFNGTKGRIELEETEKSYISGAAGKNGESCSETKRITVFPHWSTPYAVELPDVDGDHGGGDARMAKDIFAPVDDDMLGCSAGYLDGARSILTGIAANRSFETGLPVAVDHLLKL